MDKRKIEYTNVLNNIFKHDEFKDEQLKIIDATLYDRKDTIIIINTGYGKSLCYQFPSVYRNTTSIIISPLISLMQDQMNKMIEKGIPTCCLNSAQKDRHRIINQILNGDYRIVLITPEYFVNARNILETINDRVGIELFAVDEAHSISQWGSDFRPSYRKLCKLKEWFPSIPVMALTATATLKVLDDLYEVLNLNNPLVIYGNIRRENLKILIHQKSKDPLTDLISVLFDSGTKMNSSVIIYCQTRKDTEKLVKLIQNEIGIKCGAYHAGLSHEKRNDIQNKFMNDEITCIIGTISFGMGIDKPNIRKVVHYGSPKDLDSYYQEIGRCGRDGKYGECHIYYRNSDFATNKHFIKQVIDDDVRKTRKELLSRLNDYLHTETCRHQYLVKYFNGKLFDASTCKDMCDNCLNKFVPKKENFSKQAFLMLKTVKKVNGYFGLQYPILLLRGSNSKKVKYFHKTFELFGGGKKYSAKYWTEFGNILLLNNYIQEKIGKGKFGSTIKITGKGLDWLDEYEVTKAFEGKEIALEFSVTPVLEELS